MSRIEPTVFKANWVLQAMLGFVCLGCALLTYHMIEAKGFLACPADWPQAFEPSDCRRKVRTWVAYYGGLAFLVWIAVCMAWALLRDRPRVMFDERGVTIRYLLRQKGFLWSDIAGFERRDLKAERTRRYIAPLDVIRLKNGAQITLPLLMYPSEKMVIQLKAAWRQAVPL